MERPVERAKGPVWTCKNDLSDVGNGLFFDGLAGYEAGRECLCCDADEVVGLVNERRASVSVGSFLTKRDVTLLSHLVEA